MKPGPATSTFATTSSARSFSAMASASSRGFLPASFASTIAALVAMSPCVGSRGGSTTMRERSAPEPSTAARRRRDTRASMSAKRCCGLAVARHCALRLTQFGTASQKSLHTVAAGHVHLMVAPLSTDNDLTGRDRRRHRRPSKRPCRPYGSAGRGRCRCVVANFSMSFDPSSSFFTRSVSTTPGAIAFTLILSGAYSTAMERVIAATAPLAAV